MQTICHLLLPQVSVCISVNVLTLSIFHCREKLIAENMAKMPKMVADWRREKREAKQKMKDEKARRTKLLAEARERFGYAVDPRSPKFLEMVAEIETEEKKKKKLLKRRLKEEQAGIQPSVSSSSWTDMVWITVHNYQWKRVRGKSNIYKHL